MYQIESVLNKALTNSGQFAWPGFDSMLKRARIVHCSAGQTILSEGASSTEGITVNSGRLSMFKSSADGKELVVQLLHPGDFLGLALALTCEVSPVSIRAQVDSTVLMIPKNDIAEAYESEPAFSRRILTDSVVHLSSSFESARSLAHDSAVNKVAKSILLLAKEFSRYDSKCGVMCICMTREQIAESIGCAPETVFRVTKHMEAQGILDLSTRGKIVIKNLEKLQAIESQDSQT